MGRLIVDSEKCTGCESCVLACSFAHAKVFSYELSRIHVLRREDTAEFTPKVCVQCDEKLCVEVCPTNALYIDRMSGAIAIEGKKCSGCRMCADACPHQGISFSSQSAVPLVCDLCGGHPECVEVCILPQALRFADE